MGVDGSFILISGTANPLLSQKVAEQIGCPLTSSSIERFADGEIHCQIGENVRGKDTFILQPCATPVNDNLFEILVMVDALKRASARSITAIIPYFPYARQDRKTAPREPITAKLVADILTTAGVHRVLSVDLHSSSIQGFFNIPIDDLKASPLFERHILNQGKKDDLVIVSPDVGGVVRARLIAKNLSLPLAIVDKRRPQSNMAEIEHVIGDVKGKTCIMLDDMVDTGGTLIKAADFLMKKSGAQRVIAYATHGVLSGNARESIESSALEKLILSNSLNVQTSEKIEVLDISKLLAKAIIAAATNKSLSDISIL